VLSEAVNHPEIEVRDGRVITKKDGREVFFADRSRGYRAKVAIDIALERVRRQSEDVHGMSGEVIPAIVVLNQEIWEGLDGANRQAVLAHARKRKVTIYTAEASRDPDDSGEVRPEVFGSTCPTIPARSARR